MWAAFGHGWGSNGFVHNEIFLTTARHCCAPSMWSTDEQVRVRKLSRENLFETQQCLSCPSLVIANKVTLEDAVPIDSAARGTGILGPKDGNPEAGSITIHIEDKIQQKKVVVFSKSHCPFCSKAKRVFEEMLQEKKLTPTDYEVMEIENHPHCDLIQDHLHKLTGAKSVPRVFVNQRCVGGGDDVAAAYNSGKLMKLLKQNKS
ncbi:uncharacterized protein LOC143282560 [Babylonia areolata]|uniref:uncharacterized protein LOC143282560 n=1 Tax=Babylonia areolata TaxID=304850 RepID=UPI003FCF80B4